LTSLSGGQRPAPTTLSRSASEISMIVGRFLAGSCLTSFSGFFSVVVVSL